MYFYGSFLTQTGETVTVHIVTGNDRTRRVEIGDEQGGLFFTDDPVEIESSVNDTFDHLLRSQATIRLLTRDFVGELFCPSCMDAVVNIFKGDRCVFAGFIEPQTYSQGYNEVYDELELSCVDVLSALQYSKYRNVGGLGVLYEAIKANADQRAFGDIFSEILSAACSSLDITGAGGVKCFYDGSKALTADADRYGIFNQLTISELLFLGDEEDDVWQQDAVLEAMLKYLNLHIVQDGLRFYIFSWESVKGDSPISWRELTTGEMLTTPKSIIEFNNGNAASTDTTISIGEVYNQILLTCKVESVENVIESPLDNDALEDPYTNRQKYLTEYSVDIYDDGDNKGLMGAFFSMTHGLDTTYPGGFITSWYLRVKNNPNWVFPETGTGANLIDKFCSNNTDQQALPNYMAMAQKTCAALLSFGKVETKTDHKDNAPVPKIDMTDYLAVSVNGNGLDNAPFPNEASLKNSAPCAVYTGSASGGIYSPSDPGITNYIVLSGSVVLNPIMNYTNTYKELHSHNEWGLGAWMGWAKPVPCRGSDTGRLYTQQYFKAATPSAEPVWDQDTDWGLVPFTGAGPQEYEFKGSAVGDQTDDISKIAVLACMLIIGDKCVVETGADGQISDFEWRPYKTREQCADDEEYYQQCFTIGFNPKIGDKIIGTEYNLQNNIDYNVGIDAEGIAIPVRHSDRVSGQVRFMILGPVNTSWDAVARRYPVFFKFPKWSENPVPLLAHVSTIFLKSFEVKIYSDNGLINNAGDNDVVYMSDTHENFVNRKDDIEFEISSALTREECRQLGVSDSVKLSTPFDLSSGLGLLTIYDHNKHEQAKPEQLYVDSYYTEYHKPRILMKQKLDDRAGIAGLFNHYRHPAMAGKKFYVQGIGRNLIEDYAELTIKEVWND